MVESWTSTQFKPCPWLNGICELGSEGLFVVEFRQLQKVHTGACCGESILLTSSKMDTECRKQILKQKKVLYINDLNDDKHVCIVFCILTRLDLSVVIVSGGLPWSLGVEVLSSLWQTSEVDVSECLWSFLPHPRNSVWLGDLLYSPLKKIYMYNDVMLLNTECMKV